DPGQVAAVAGRAPRAHQAVPDLGGHEAPRVALDQEPPVLLALVPARRPAQAERGRQVVHTEVAKPRGRVRARSHRPAGAEAGAANTRSRKAAGTWKLAWPVGDHAASIAPSSGWSLPPGRSMRNRLKRQRSPARGGSRTVAAEGSARRPAKGRRASAVQ